MSNCPKFSFQGQLDFTNLDSLKLVGLTNLKTLDFSPLCDLNRSPSSLRCESLSKLEVKDCSLEQLTINPVSKRYLSLPKLQSLVLGGNSLQVLTIRATEIERLDLSECHNLETINLSDMPELMALKLPKGVKSVTIARCNKLATINIDVDAQSDLNLTSLNIESCPNLELKPCLDAISGSLKELVLKGRFKLSEGSGELNLRGLRVLKRLELSSIIYTHLGIPSNLEDVKVTSSEALTSVVFADRSSLKALKNCHLRGCRQLQIVFSDLFGKALENLNLECLSIRDASLVDMLRECPNLSEIVINPAEPIEAVQSSNTIDQKLLQKLDLNSYAQSLLLSLPDEELEKLSLGMLSLSGISDSQTLERLGLLKQIDLLYLPEYSFDTLDISHVPKVRAIEVPSAPKGLLLSIIAESYEIQLKRLIVDADSV